MRILDFFQDLIDDDHHLLEFDEKEMEEETEPARKRTKAD